MIRVSFSLLLPAALLLGQQPKPPAAKPSPAVNFQREIRPILSDNCFACHGPDKNTRVGLRLDLKDDVFAARQNGAAIVPGKPEASLLYQRIAETNAARRMPPSHSNKVLTGAQKEAIRRWIAQGAKWEEHWAFRAPVRPVAPAVRTRGWARNPMDQFVLAKLEAAALKPAPEADRRTLARRVSLDLTGLPPAPEDVDSFVSDKSPDAYEKYVDKLLMSPHWGEHRARYWLDAARYADTHGIHVDNYREMWPYRDWVINAFNRNLPFDKFTIEQVAGDLLPNRTMDQQIATGFHRCNATTNEAGVIIDEVEAIYAKDRVDTTGAVWLGLTVGCSSCHDHKFDPLSQRDFYSMAAFFRNTTQNAMDGNVPDTPPVIVVPRDEDRARWDRVVSEEAATRVRMQEARNAADSAFDQWLGSAERKGLRQPLDAKSEILAVSLEGAPKVTAGKETTNLSLPDGVTLADADIAGRKAIHFAKETKLELPVVEHINSDTPFSIAVKFFYPKGEDQFIIASQSNRYDDNRGWVIEVLARVADIRLIGDEGRSIQVRAGHLQQLKPGTWNHLVFTYDGGRDQAGLNMYLNGRAIPTQGRGDQNTTLKGEIRTWEPIRLGNQDKRYFQDGAVADFRVFDRVVSEEEARLLAEWPVMDAANEKEQLSTAERDAFHLWFLNYRNDDYRQMAAKMVSFAGERLEIRRRGSVTHVMEERKDQPAFAHILYRGMYDRPKDRVEPNVPAALPPMPASAPRNRLGLAQWLVDASNPLTSRVTVNRFWQEVFGNGLVKTAEDFGSQGLPPTHPELLDWLAVEFRESGWDMKKFFKMMVTSATYRQSAGTTPEKLAADPENKLLSRGPRFRLDGELVRDYALSASGLLAPAIGGPSVKPYQPDGVWERVAMVGSNTRFYQRDSGDRLYRRSLYTFWKRSAPPASMEIFNAPTREQCTVRRERTNTPLQALVTMNDEQFVEAARSLAERALKSDRANFERQIDYLTSHLIARNFDVKEREIARRAYKDYLTYYDSHPEDAKKLLAIGEAKPDGSLPAAESAAMTMLANQLLNLDEVLVK